MAECLDLKEAPGFGLVQLWMDSNSLSNAEGVSGHVGFKGTIFLGLCFIISIVF